MKVWTINTREGPNTKYLKCRSVDNCKKDKIFDYFW